MSPITITVCLIASYLLGGISFSYLAGRLVLKRDLRELGSGNLGATNTFRQVGPAWGLIVMLLDAAKGWLAVWLTAGFCGAGLWPALAGLAAILGHSFTPYLRFRGGKGVATSAGVFLALAPAALGLAALVFALVLALSRYVSVASLAASAALPLLIWWRDPQAAAPLALACLVTLLIWLRHASNIRRLFKGEEGRFEFGRQGGGR